MLRCANKKMQLLLCIGIFIAVCIADQDPLEEVYQWKYFDYTWRNADHKAMAIASGDYDHKKSIIIDVDRWKDERVFVTILRNKGVPSSLNVVSQRKGPGGPLLQPFPNWDWAETNNCSGIINVYRVAIDQCDRLWVLDTGRINGENVCTAQLLVFDLNTNKLVKRVKIPDNIARSSKTNIGGLVTPIVETHGPNCKDTTVYMADTEGYGLVIYDKGKLWRLEAEVFNPDPSAKDYIIDGESFTMEDGILGMAKHPKIPILYFRPMSSYNLHCVSTIALKRSYSGAKVRYRTAQKILPSQSAAMAISSNGSLLFGLHTQLAIGRLNIFKSLDYPDIVAYNREKLQFASGVKIIPSNISGKDEEIWMVTNRFQKIMAGTMKFNEVNFRVMRANVNQLTVDV